MIAITGAVLVINGGLNSSSVFATNGEVWYHYAAVAPTDTTHGSKEFWASSSDGCATHQFTNPGVTCIDRDFSTYDSFATLTWDDDRYVLSLNEQRDLGIIPVVTENTVTYGLYPQTNVNDSSLVSALNALTTPGTNGYYLYENAYYAKASARPFEDNTEFDNGTTIVEGTTYWFKCEPITWNILSNNNGEYYILSSVLLDARRYGVSSNYENSEIRTWLNNGFYNSAFALDDSHIQTTTVDNSASTTHSNDNPYASNNTQDKMFLPSYRDYTNSGYGFSTKEDSTPTRYCKTTDWTRARGAYVYDSGSYKYNGHYWTRSPYSDEYDDDDYVWIVCPDGYITENNVYDDSLNVRPALSFKIA